MYIVLLRFSENKSQAGEFMDAHNTWLKQGFDKEVFILAGSLQHNQGGGIMAHNTTLEELQDRVNNDPFVANDIVRAEILEITPAKADDRLQFLCN